jgi:spermidine synthase
VILARQSSRVTALYGADLSGGAIACLAVVPLLNSMGAPNAVLFAALVSSVASAVWSQRSSWRAGAVSLAALVAILIVVNSSRHWMDVVWAKGVRRKNVEFAQWNAISRVEVDRNADGSRVIVIDADASSFIMNTDPARWAGSEAERRLMSTPAAVVNELRPHGDYAIIGPGGGVDVLRAVANGSSSVTAIEINPIIADTIMRKRYRDFAYRLYERPDVHVHIADGRSFIRNANKNFDVVEMTLVDTWAATSAGAFALSENSLYSTEAFREYFEHLKPDGMIAVTRWEFREPREALRVVSLAIEALRELGETDARRQFFILSQGELNVSGISVTVLAKKSPFSPEEEAILRDHLRKYPESKLLYSPSSPLANAFTALIQSKDPAAFEKQYAYNIAPVSDNAPFFFFTLKPEQIWRSLKGTHAIDWKVNLGVAVLLMLLLISFLAVVAFLALPLVLKSNAAGKPLGGLLYFAAIGLGYMLVEITFIQRFVLFLGHPTYALTVVVFLLLLCGGAGSALSRRWLQNPGRLWLPILTIMLTLALYAAILPILWNRLVGAPFAAKVLISVFVLAPLGFIMGMPFPAGVRLLSSHADESGNSIEWAWAMNGGASVFGSVLAMVIALEFGLTITLVCGAAAYLLALLLQRKLPRVPASA